MIFALYSSFSGLLHEEQAEEIYGPANAAVAGQLQPGAAVAAPAANGFRVSGRWPFGSGGANATWFVGQCVLGDPPEPPAPGQLPNIRLVFMPREEVEIILNWNTIGLRGTGSNDYVVKDAVIPAERTVNLLSPKPHRPEPIYRFPPLVLFPAILPSVMVGVARAAIDLCCGLIEGKRSGIPPTPVLEQPRAQGELGRADALVESARNYAISLLDEATSCITAGERIPGRLAARLNASAALTSAACRDAIAVAFATAGSRSVHEANRMARHMRDVQAASLHAATSYSQFEMAGRVLLGLQERPLGG
jgi:alkylation response protein AidB-like acyl-CoA dehydrogenase